MTAATQPATPRSYEVGTIVGGGLKLGIITALGVTVFALVSRVLEGTPETVVQSLLVLAGGVIFGFLPAVWLRPSEVDSIAWSSLVGLLGALTFTIIDTAVLRPLHLYHFTWDLIGGGSGFWYIPVWWMGSAVTAWLGSWSYAIAGDPAKLTSTVAQTLGLALVIFLILVVTGIAPFHTAVMALAFALALIVHIPLAATLRKQ
ncbi:MAG: hypothetical protein ACE5HT_03210 [Gemmatimonadales bacterium]